MKPFVAIALAFFCVACGKQDPTYPKSLKAWNVLDNPQAIACELRTPLFSDYAEKQRAVLMPAMLFFRTAFPAILLIAALQAQPSQKQIEVDRIFAAFNTHTPGCAVGVANKGVIELRAGYGMADLERNVAITGRLNLLT